MWKPFWILTWAPFQFGIRKTVLELWSTAWPSGWMVHRKGPVLLLRFDFTSGRAGWPQRGLGPPGNLGNWWGAELGQVQRRGGSATERGEPQLENPHPSVSPEGIGGLREATRRRVCAATSTKWGLESISRSKGCLRNCLQ